MDTIAEMLLARAGDGRPGMVAEDEEWTWRRDRRRRRGPGRAPGRRGGPRGPSTWPPSSTTCPSTSCGWAPPPWPGPSWSGGNSTHRGDRPRPRPGPHRVPAPRHRSGPSRTRRRDSTWGPASARRRRRAPGSWWSTTPGTRPSSPPTPARRSPIRPALGVGEDSLGYLIFTSGTSGAPKACRCTQGRLARIGMIVAQMFALTVDDVCYVSMPLFHSNALMAGLSPAIAAGATIALPSGGRFSASGFLADVRRHGVTYFNYVGKPLSYILATPERPDDAENSLRAGLRQRGRRSRHRRASASASAAWWSTATGPPRAAPPCSARPTRRAVRSGGPRRGRWSSTPRPGEACPVARFDDDGVLVNSEEAVGELVSADGGSGFEGYWRNDEAELARLRNGWYWTGDLAYRDEAGFFYFAGRSDDWLRVDGENFAAAPVARILERHPDVVLAAVYAVPDTVVGDQVMAALQLRPGAGFEPGRVRVVPRRPRATWGRSGRHASCACAPSSPSPPPRKCSCARCGPSGGTPPTRCGGDRAAAPMGPTDSSNRPTSARWSSPSAGAEFRRPWSSCATPRGRSRPPARPR